MSILNREDQNQSRNAFLNDHDYLQLPVGSEEMGLTRGAGNFIYLLIKSMNARRILQIGTFGGNNTLWLGSAASFTRGLVVALQCDHTKSEIARLNFKTANLLKHIQLIDQNLIEVLPTLQPDFDLLFLDAPVVQYVSFFKLAFPKIRNGGVILSDRAISHRHELGDFIKYMNHLKEIENVLVPVGKGLIMSYKLKKEATA